MSNSISCLICHETYTSMDDIYSTSCGHVYHYSCMQQWKSRSTSCPQCRTHNPDCFKLYLSFEPEDETKIKRLEEEKKQILKDQEQIEKNISEMQLKLDEKQNTLTAMRSEMESMVTNLGLLQSKLDESDEKNIKLISQLDESIFNGSRIELELETVKNEFMIIQRDSGTSSADLEKFLNMSTKIKFMELEIREKNDKIQFLSMEKIKLEYLLTQSKTNGDNSDVKAELKMKEELLKILEKRLFEEIKKNSQLSLEIDKKDTIKFKQKKTPKSNLTAIESLQNIQIKQNTDIEHVDDGEKLSIASVKGYYDGRNINHRQQSNFLESSPFYGRPRMETEGNIKIIQNSVSIKGFETPTTESKFKNIVIKLAQMMELSISEDDIANLTTLKNLLIVEFKKQDDKIKFLSNKAKLRTNPETMGLKIQEYNDKNTHSLYHFALVLKNFGFRVFSRSNTVYACKNNIEHKIYNTQCVHKLIQQNRQTTAPLHPLFI